MIFGLCLSTAAAHVHSSCSRKKKKKRKSLSPWKLQEAVGPRRRQPRALARKSFRVVVEKRDVPLDPKPGPRTPHRLDKIGGCRRTVVGVSATALALVEE
jgi:hypothetical protein